MEPHGDVTDLLNRWRQGDPAASDEVITRVYDELKQHARKVLRYEARIQEELSPTDLLHDVFSELMRNEDVDWENRRHFFNTAARIMRYLLLNHARKRSALKRGSGQKVLPLDSLEIKAGETDIDALLNLDQAIRDLEQVDPKAAHLVELRHFTGLTIRECSDILKIPIATCNRKWSFAKAFLKMRLI